MHIRKGDNVIVLTGKDKGKKGAVTSVLRDSEKVVVEGVHVVKRHQRAKKSGQKGTTVSVALPIHISNVALIDSKTGKGTRVSLARKGKKIVRISKKSGAEI
ncbi:MAG: 50S ribosomal protein L24 [Candidatus Lloydbacteria bacterium RIFCSPHIGHO2_01_FULL_41_20]|uniref:Large ribosomal subunit protein uL24 n=1 Tax=Candidatus Lloydbacteria bacterium RIFCSPHIGHO2_01_FULL_41_20 TaxID=1798657 RepID=A0A1G2CRN6_9BACT|nr:MAG: 50S ribosomal protein L24 [Candidatus Lloydbacteria bacterium RIFCSPHIGHO2_01_FULL_41_20]